MPNHAPGARPRWSGRHAHPVDPQPTRSRTAHPHRLEPGETLDAVRCEIDQPDADLDRIGPVHARRNEGVGQVREPGRPGLLPGEPPRPVHARHRGRARHRATRGRAATVLGRRVVDQRSLLHDRAKQTVAERLWHVHRIHERPDDMDLHREPEGGRSVERAQRHQDFG
jgi:hypothetical protein